MARRGGAGRRFLVGGGLFVFAWWFLSAGGVAHANCQLMPDDPMCQPPATSPPATQPPQQNTHTSSVSNSNSNTPAVRSSPPRVVLRTPPRENLTPRRTSTFQPAVPAAPTENFQPPTVAADPTPLPEVQLGAVDVAASTPQPQPAPAPPAPPAPADDLNLPAVAGAGIIGGIGLSALDRQRKRYDESDANFKLGIAQMAAGGAIALGSSVAGTAVATAAMSMTLPFWMAAGIAVGIGVGVRGLFNVLDAYPKSEATGAAAHAGSVRG